MATVPTTAAEHPLAAAPPAMGAKQLGTTSFVVIPARMHSTRLPKKLLLNQTGKPIIQHTYEAATTAKKPAGIVVATDHEQIAIAVARFGGRAILTDPNASSGTDRVAEAARSLPQVDILVNVQGDEPEVPGEAIDQVIALLESNPDAAMSTLATPIRTRRQLQDPACVKVVFDSAGKALYFSRSPIPYVRDWDDALLTDSPARFHQHIGLYAYRREFLQKLAAMPRSRLEKCEDLEQLRVLAAGHAIVVGSIDHPSIGIDTLEDYRAFVSKTIGR